MSFFIRKRGASSLPGKLTDRVNGVKQKSTRVGSSISSRGRGRKRGPGATTHIPQKVQKRDDDEITSESEEDEEEKEIEDQEDSDDGETPQEARVRLAKEQIKELRRKQVEKHGVDVDDDVLGEVLKEQELVEEGKVLRNVVPDGYAEKNLNVDVVVKGKVLKTPLTSIHSTPTSIYASTKSGLLIHYNIPTRTRTIKTLKSRPVTSIAVLNNIVAASTPSSIHILDPKTLEITHTFNNSRNAVFLSISPETLYSCHKDRTIKLWNIQERAYVESLFGHQDIPTCVDVVLGNRIVSAGGFDKTLRCWKIEEESQLVYNWDEDVIEYVSCISGGYFVASSCAGSIGLFSFGRKKPLHVINKAHGVDGNGVARWVTCVGGVGDLVVSGSDHGVVKVWKVVARKLSFVRDICVPDGVVIGVNVHVLEEREIMIVIGLGTELRNGRWSGRKSNCSKIVIVS